MLTLDGLFDKLKNKAQQAINQVQGQPQGQAPQQGYDQQAYEQQQAYQQQSYQQPPQGYPQPAGPSFHWDGENLPMPVGWDNLSIDDWFYKYEKLRDRQMHIDQERLPPMTDADGDVLDPEEVLLIQDTRPSTRACTASVMASPAISARSS